jgi:Polyketide cyclase / dehydrase and lipid transport
MATNLVSTERTVDAPVGAVYGYIADMRGHHPHFLPPAFSDFQVESGGVGEGTITRFTLTAGGRTRPYRMKVAEPEPGRILTESDTGSSAVTTFTVTPQGGRSLVRISTTWEGAGGVAASLSACSPRGSCAAFMRMSWSGSARRLRPRTPRFLNPQSTDACCPARGHGAQGGMSG